MKRILSAAVIAALTTTWVGCQQSTESTTPVAQSTPAESPDATASEEASEESASAVESSAEESSSEYTLVSLKVPNMH